MIGNYSTWKKSGSMRLLKGNYVSHTHTHTACTHTCDGILEKETNLKKVKSELAISLWLY